jgi:16S rRNA (guanine527-N7)-methyltransferase
MMTRRSPFDAMNESLSTVTSGKDVSRETEERLNHFAALFQKWASKINLVAPSTMGELWSRHIVDSLQIYRLSPGPFRWIDLGSGGGFPGVITAICLAELKDGWVHLVESNNKKAAFLRTALQETGARGSVHPVRIETAPELIPACDRVSARALADLDKLLEFISPWAARNGDLRAFLHKGRDYRREVEISNRRWNLDLVEHQSSVEKDSVILEISGLARKSD